MNPKFIIYCESFNVPKDGISSMADIENAVFVETDHVPEVIASFDSREEAYAEFAKYKSNCMVVADGAYVGQMYFISTEVLDSDGGSMEWSGSDCAAWEKDIFSK